MSSNSHPTAQSKPNPSTTLTPVIHDVAHNEIHRRLISGLAKGDIIDAYADWAPMYDRDCVNSNTCYKLKSAEMLVGALLDLPDITGGQDQRKVNILDVACGTGVPSEHVRRIWAQKSSDLANNNTDLPTLCITGVDFSPHMLAEVSKRPGVFDAIIEADVSQPLPLPPASFDAFLVIGLLVDGHCGPDILHNIARYVKPRAIGVITVRRKTYERKQSEYLDEFKRAGLTVKASFFDEYMKDIEGNYIILEKTA